MSIKNKKNLIILIFFIFITMLFFSYAATITYDSSHYLWLASLLTKEGDFSTWDIARGPVFPMFIWICNMLFGHNSNALLVGMYALYLLMLGGCYLIYKETIKSEELFNKKLKYIFIFLFLLLVVFNPMIIGYYHTLLTEFIAITLAVFGCYFAWKWIDVDFFTNKKMYIIYTIEFALLTAVSWQLKQPNVSTIIFPVIIAAIVSFIRKPNFKNFLQRFITLLCCIIVLACSIKIWNTILENGNVEMRKDRSSSGFFAAGIINGLEGYEVREKEPTTGEAIKIWFKELGKNPIKLIGHYVDNYLATISFYDIEFEGMKIKTNKNINLKHSAEIEAIGYKIYGYGNECVFPLSPEYEPYAADYREINKPIVAINWVMRKLELPANIVMKITYVVLPLLTIISIIAVFVTKKKYSVKYSRIIDIVAILFTYSLLNIIGYAVLGSIIDRYTMPSLVTTYIGVLLSIYAIIYRKKYKNV